MAPRQKAYEDFLSAGHHLELVFEAEEITWDELSPPIHDVHKLAATVSVVGPRAAAEAAEAVPTAIARTLFRQRDNAIAPGDDLTSALRQFAVAARLALDNDSQPEITSR